MSSKNILTLSKETYVQKNEQRLLRLSDAYYFNAHFLLGKGVSRDEMVFSTIFSKFLYESNCEINKIIKDKIAGKLEKRKKKNPIILTKTEDVDSTVINKENYWDLEVEW